MGKRNVLVRMRSSEEGKQDAIKFLIKNPLRNIANRSNKKRADLGISIPSEKL